MIDLDRLEANLVDLQSYADTNGIALSPHTKTHKSPEIGIRQLELGAAGLTVAKTGEAQVFQEAGAPRILVHYPLFGADKWERLADIAAAGVELTVVVDSVPPAEGLALSSIDGASLPTCRRAPSRPAPNDNDVAGRSGRRAALEAPHAEGRRRQLYSGSLPPRRPRLAEKLGAVDALLRETRDAFNGQGCVPTASRAARHRRATSTTRRA